MGDSLNTQTDGDIKTFSTFFESSVNCTICNTQVFPKIRKSLYAHPVLKVVLCRTCFGYYGRGDFTKDEDGTDKFCRWCADGGVLLMCDNCENVFCRKCIKSNLSRSDFKLAVKSNNWNCLICDPTPIKSLQEKYFRAIALLQNHELQKKKIEKAAIKDKQIQENIATSSVVSIKNSGMEVAFSTDQLSKDAKSLMSKLSSTNKSLRKCAENFSPEQYPSIKDCNQLKKFINLQQKIISNLINQNLLQLNKNGSDTIRSESPPQYITEETKKDPSASSKSSEKSHKDENDCDHIGSQVLNLISESMKTRENLQKGRSQADEDSSSPLSSSSYSSEHDFLNDEEDKKRKSNRRKSFKKRRIESSSSSILDSGSDEDSDSSKTNKTSFNFTTGEPASGDKSLLMTADDIAASNLIDMINESQCSSDNQVMSNDEDVDFLLSKAKDGETRKMKKTEDASDHKNDLKTDEVDDQEESKSSDEDEEIKEASKKFKRHPLLNFKIDESDEDEVKSVSAKKRAKQISSDEEGSDRKRKRARIESDSPVVVDDVSKDAETEAASQSLFSQLSTENNKQEDVEKRASSPSSSSEKSPASGESSNNGVGSPIRISSDEEQKSSSEDEKFCVIRRKKKKKDITDYFKKNSDDDFQSNIASRTRTANKKRKRSIDEELESSPSNIQGGRRNIRKIIDQKGLSESTRDAELRERRRKLRLQNQEVIIVPDDSKVSRIVLSEDPQVEIDENLLSVLKPHQIEGVRFLWNNTIETIETANRNKGDGCILAHCMGLGKTLQAIAFLHTVLLCPHLKLLQRALVLCPTGVVLNWQTEIIKWTSQLDRKIPVDTIPRYTDDSRLTALREWKKKGGVMIVGYAMFRNLCSVDEKNSRKKFFSRQFKTYLVDPGPDIVICDEGHILKNSETSLSSNVNQIKTKRRIILTGTPLQNNLREYHCMVNFVKPNLLGTLKEFNNRFANPIQNGQHTDSTADDVKLMKSRSHVLHEIVSGFVQRKDVKCLSEQLVPKFEYVLLVRLTPLQIRMYEKYLQMRLNEVQKNKRLFADFQTCLLIVSHPRVFEIYKRKKLESQFVLESTDTENEESSDSDNPDRVLLSKIDQMSIKELKEVIERKQGNFQQCREKSELKQLARSLLSASGTLSTDWYDEVIPKDSKLLESLENSGKMVLLMQILKSAEKIGDKVVVFSQSITTIEMIELFLTEEYTESGSPKWVKGIDYFRIDGRISNESRKSQVDSFNDVENDARLFLVSTRAGGIGINLIGANRVVIFDACWNPTLDLQSIFRIYRFGQKKQCYIYRFIAQGTMEEKVYDRQINKQSLAFRVIDEQQIERHFTANDLAELYQFCPDRGNINLPANAEKTVYKSKQKTPKDALLQGLMKDHRTNRFIVSFHEQDTLLDHQVEEELTVDERTKAWDEYDRESHPPVSANNVLNRLPANTLKKLIELGEKDLARNKHLITCFKNITFDSIIFYLATCTDISKDQLSLKATECLSHLQRACYQLHQTRQYFIHKIEQANYCMKNKASAILPPTNRTQYVPRYPRFQGSIYQNDPRVRSATDYAPFMSNNQPSFNNNYRFSNRFSSSSNSNNRRGGGGGKW